MNKQNKGYINQIINSLLELSKEIKDKDASFILSKEDYLEELYNKNINYLEEILYQEEALLENNSKGKDANEEIKKTFKNVNRLDGAIDKLDSLVDALDDKLEGNDIIARINVIVDKLNELQ